MSQRQRVRCSMGWGAIESEPRLGEMRDDSLEKFTRESLKRLRACIE